MTNEKQCFLIFNNDNDANLIRQILKNQMVMAIDQFVFSSEDQLFNFSIREKIKTCNTTIAIISEFTPNVSLEIGISIGLNKPTLIILIKEELKIPDNLSTVQIVRSPSDDINILTISVEEFLNKNKKGRGKIENKKLKITENSQIVQNKLSQIEKIRKNGSEIELIKILEDFFHKDLAIEKIKSSYKTQDRGIDFMIWDYDPSNNLNKPIPVEIKLGHLSPSKINNSELQLITTINRFEGNFGILLYLDREGKRFDQSVSLTPLIIRMDIVDFIQKIEGNNLLNFILSQRNKIAHKGE